MTDRTTIALKHKTRDRLDSLFERHIPYDFAVNRLIDRYQMQEPEVTGEYIKELYAHFAETILRDFEKVVKENMKKGVKEH